MKNRIEIEEQIRELLDKRENIPTGVKKDEEKLWRSFCEGGISSLYWVLQKENPYTK